MTIFLMYDGELKYSVDQDTPKAFAKMDESTSCGCNERETITWKISATPGTLEKIKIKKVNKKNNVKLPNGKWKDSWNENPTRVSNSEYTGQPGGDGATKECPFYFAYDVDYMLSDRKGWLTLDPDIRIPEE